MPRRLPTVRLRAVAASTIVLVAVSLVACAPGTPEPSPTPSASGAPQPTPTQTAPAAPAPDVPILHPDGSAEDNLPFFTAITAQVWAAGNGATGRAYIDALIAAGFDRAAMQVTRDATTVGNPVESLQFSVRWGDEDCLVGQVGPSTGDPVTAVIDQLAEGRCLVGNTRPIDW